MHLLSFMKLILIGSLVGLFCPTSFANDSCFEWFLALKIKSEVTKKACEIACSAASTDMETFDCAEKCDYFCENRKCIPIWSKNKVKNCKPVNEEIRRKILETAVSEKFKRLKYESPPKSEQAIDCSHFVHSIYSAVSLEFTYQPTGTVVCVKQFAEISRGELKKGDIVVYKDHVGIYMGKDQIISATVGGRRQLAKLDPSNPLFIPSIQSLNIDTFGNPTKFLRWDCGK